MKNNDSRLVKVNHFYNAARSEPHRTLLAEAGFSEKSLEEGITLLNRAVELARVYNFSNERDSSLLGQLDAYQRRWFPAVRATLDRHYPDLSKQFFKNMVQLDGKQSPISVLEFLGTLERLGKGEPPFGEKGPEARALLTTRLLTAEVEAEGRALLAAWDRPAAPRPRVLVEKDEVEAAIVAAWNWRAEWVEHARAVITKRSLLRDLGMGRRTKKNASADDSVTAPALPLAPVAPARLSASPTPAPTSPAIMNGTHIAPGE